MSNEEQSRRGFLKGAGFVAGGILGGAAVPEVTQAQGQTRTTPLSKGARFRAALATGQPLMLPVVESKAMLLAQLAGLSALPREAIIRPSLSFWNITRKNPKQLWRFVAKALLLTPAALI